MIFVDFRGETWEVPYWDEGKFKSYKSSKLSTHVLILKDGCKKIADIQHLKLITYFATKK